MSCLLPLIAGVCIASPSNLTLEGEVAVKVAGSIDYVTRNGVSNTLGRAAVMMEVPVSTRFSAAYGIEHRSAIWDNSDRGSEYALVRLQWRPFR